MTLIISKLLLTFEAGSLLAPSLLFGVADYFGNRFMISWFAFWSFASRFRCSWCHGSLVR